LWDSLNKFKEALLQDRAKDALMYEDTAVAREALQMTWDATDSAARVVTSAVAMRCSSWLQSSGLSQKMQSTIQDLLFEGAGLFSELTDLRLLGLKDSRATLRSLGLHTPQQARKPFHSPSPLTPQSRSWGDSLAGHLQEKGSKWRRPSSSHSATQPDLSRNQGGQKQSF
ncbi:hypothetical protein UY3_10751, partial [Chelonia mydas]